MPCSICFTLYNAWHRIPNAAAALEVGHAVLTNQDDYYIDADSLSHTKETTDLFHTAAFTFVTLGIGAPHLAAAVTHDSIEVVLHAVYIAAKYNTKACPSYATPVVNH